MPKPQRHDKKEKPINTKHLEVIRRRERMRV
jgi:hypothetical protein